MHSSEQETTVTYSNSDEEVMIYSCIRKDITAMKKKAQFEVVDEGTYTDGTIWARFKIHRNKFDISRAAKTTRNMSDEARAAAADRLLKARGL